MPNASDIQSGSDVLDAHALFAFLQVESGEALEASLIVFPSELNEQG